VREVLDRLEVCWKKRQLITVLTHDKTYSNMGITGYSETRKGFDREISMSLKEVRVTKTRTVSIPASYGKSGKTGTSAGNASTSGGSSGGAGGSGLPAAGQSEAYKRGFALFAG
jgi:uncharacterized membrane protein YgcG